MRDLLEWAYEFLEDVSTRSTSTIIQDMYKRRGKDVGPSPNFVKKHTIFDSRGKPSPYDSRGNLGAHRVKVRDIHSRLTSYYQNRRHAAGKAAIGSDPSSWEKARRRAVDVAHWKLEKRARQK